MAPERTTTMSNPIINATKGPQTRDDYLAEQARLNQSPQVGHSGNTYVAQEVHDTRVTTTARPKTTAAYATDVNTDRVIVNGAEMLRSTYINLLATGGLPPGSTVDDPTARRLEAEAKADGSFTDAVTDSNANGDGNEGGDEAGAGSDPAVEAVFKAGQSAMDAARAELGGDAVQSLIGEAVASGDLDAVKASLADGNVKPEQVAKVYAAYVASAHEMVAETGMSVETMAEVLDEEDLRSAREAVVKGDVSRVQDMAAKAVETLAVLPETNPEAFQEYIDRRFPDLAYKVEKGKTLISTNHGWIPFESLVRGGLLRGAKLDPSVKVVWGDGNDE